MLPFLSGSFVPLTVIQLGAPLFQRSHPINQARRSALVNLPDCLSEIAGEKKVEEGLAKELHLKQDFDRTDVGRISCQSR
jgi:hypothetical protein